LSILVVGSVALDSIQTPFGSVKETLGGSATYFSAVARLYDEVDLVAIVGTDFSQKHIDFLKERDVDLDGLQIAEGRTFRWSGRYGYDMNTAETLDTQLNVFATFHPELPEKYKDAQYIFLANIDPELQLEVLSQIRRPRLTVLDTMNYWINYRKKALSQAISAVDIVLINEAEARQYANTFSLIRAADPRRAQDPRPGPQGLGDQEGRIWCSHVCQRGQPDKVLLLCPSLSSGEDTGSYWSWRFLCRRICRLPRATGSDGSAHKGLCHERGSQARYCPRQRSGVFHR